MVAVFWIETVEEILSVPPYHVGEPPFALRAKRSVQGQRVPTFSVTPPFDLDKPRELTVTFTQIQYTPDRPAEFCQTDLAACLGEYACAGGRHYCSSLRMEVS